MIFSFIKKEFLLITRDIHALWVLFVMPLIFILIMSYALKNSFSGVVDTKYKVALIAQEEAKDLKSLVFDFKQIKTHESAGDLLYKKGFDFAVLMPQSIGGKTIKIYAKTSISPQYVNMLKTQISLNLQATILKEVPAGMMGFNGANDFNITDEFIGKNGGKQKITSVDQSVPSWLIFSMFFILIPISNTFMNEKNFGTFDKLKSMNVPVPTILMGKFIPYLLINQVQVFIIFLTGIFIMPLIGLDSLEVRGGYGWVGVISLFTSCAAISFGLLIANIASSSEEATTIGGVSNIIFAAIGGIMVPKFVMPKTMQDISELSPMSWSLESFLGVIVGDVNYSEIGLNMVKLAIFALACLAGAYIMLRKKESNR